MRKVAFILTSILLLACNKDKEIKELLSGPKAVDRIEGCYAAMATNDVRYVPLLLKHSGEWDATTDIRYKGTSVYEADMRALSKLLGVNPPHPIDMEVDSLNVKFFFYYWEKFEKDHPIKSTL